jgi:quercetin dioxygenase-like cupin family protein
MTQIPHLTHIALDALEPTTVADGIARRGLPGGAVAARAFDFAAGAVWPETDHHTSDELIYVVSGELIDNGLTFPAGSYLHYEPGSSHRPSSNIGARILVFSLPATTAVDA